MAVNRATFASSMVLLIHSRTDGNTGEAGRRRLDIFDAVPLRLIPPLVAPSVGLHPEAEGEGNRQGKKSVNEAHSY